MSVDRAEQDRQHREEIESWADRERQHAPAPLGLEGSGQELYERAGKPGWAPWAELPTDVRRAWAQCERFLAHKQRMASLPGALRFELPETEPERSERHVDALVATLKHLMMHVGHTEESLRLAAEELLAVAETGI